MPVQVDETAVLRPSLHVSALDPEGEAGGGEDNDCRICWTSQGRFFERQSTHESPEARATHFFLRDRHVEQDVAIRMAEFKFFFPSGELLGWCM